MPDTDIGLDTVDNIITMFLQQSGWYAYVTADGDLVIGPLSYSPPTVTIAEGVNIINAEIETSYDKTRNKILVFGGSVINPSGVSLITATAEAILDFLPVDQTVVLASPYIRTTEDAQTIANNMLTILGKETNIKTITVLGDPNIRGGIYISVESDVFTGTALVTSCYSSFDENGYLMLLVLDDLCPRFTAVSSYMNFFDSPAMYALSRKHLCRTRDLTTYPAGGPFWEIVVSIDAFDSGLNSRFDGFILDPWDPKNKAYIWLYNETLRTIVLYEVDNLNDIPGNQIYTQIFRASNLPAECNYMSVEASITVEGAVFTQFITGTGSTGYYYFGKRMGYGSSFSTYSFGTVGVAYWMFRELGCIALGHHSGRIYVPHWRLSLSTTIPIRQSNNFGDTWTTAYSPIPGDPYWLGPAVIPYMDETDTLLYFAAHNNEYPRTNSNVYRWDGTNLTQISPTYPGGGYHNIGGSRVEYTAEYIRSSFRTGLWNYTYNKDIVRFVDGYYLLLSEDGGDTWTRKSLPANFLHGMGGWPFSSDIVLAWGYGGFQLSLDEGDTWINLQGDWVTVTGENMRLIQAVPVWVP